MSVGCRVTSLRALKSSARESRPPDRSGSLTLGSEKPRPPFSFHGSSAACTCTNRVARQPSMDLMICSRRRRMNDMTVPVLMVLLQVFPAA